MAKVGLKSLVLGAVFLVCSAAHCTDAHDAKLLPDESPVEILGKIVTYASVDTFYVEEEPRTCGIRVEKPSHGIPPGVLADVSGVIRTNGNGERYIEAATVTGGYNASVDPLGMTNAAVGGADWQFDSMTGAGQRGVTNGLGLNNIGLLIRTFGECSPIDSDTFLLDDGSGVGVECVLPAGMSVDPAWEFVAVSGISSLRYDDVGLQYVPVVLVSTVDTIPEVIATPDAPEGETNPAAGVTYLHCTSPVTTSLNHEVEYSFDWDDGSTPEWSMFTGARHSWATPGPKSVTVTARCRYHTDVCATSQPLAVNVTDELAWQRTGPIGRRNANSFVIHPNGLYFAGTIDGVFRSTDQGSTWLELNTLRTNSFAINPSGHIFAGYHIEGGIYRSTDYGDRWVPVNNGLGSLNVRALHSDAQGKLYAAPKDLYCSTDNGDNWTLAYDFPGTLEDIVEDSAGRLFIGGRGGCVYRSLDNGLTWQPSSNGIAFSSCYDLDVGPGDQLVAACSTGGVYTSFDHGDNWTCVGMASEETPVKCVALNSHGHIFASVPSADGLYRTTDNGANWELLPGEFGFRVTVYPDDTVYAIGFTIQQSVDNGDTWTTISDGLGPGPTYDVVQTTIGSFIAVGHRVICRSVDGGDNWTQVASSESHFHDVATNALGHIFAVGWRSIFRSVDDGVTWTEVWEGPEYSYPEQLAVSAAGSVFAYVEDYTLPVPIRGKGLRSTDNGDTWDWCTPASHPYYAPCGLAAAPDGYVYYSSRYIVDEYTPPNGLYRSDDDGLTWTHLLDTYSGGPIPLHNRLMANALGHLFAAYSTGAFYRSTDRGDSWTQMTDLPQLYPKICGINSAGHIFAGYWTPYRSTDDGATWEAMGVGLSGMSGLVYGMEFAVDGRAYIATSYGVYRTTRPITE